jgi:hypothetical protein
MMTNLMASRQTRFGPLCRIRYTEIHTQIRADFPKIAMLIIQPQVIYEQHQPACQQD